MFFDFHVFAFLFFYFLGLGGGGLRFMTPTKGIIRNIFLPSLLLNHFNISVDSF